MPSMTHFVRFPVLATSIKYAVELEDTLASTMTPAGTHLAIQALALSADL